MESSGRGKSSIEIEDTIISESESEAEGSDYTDGEEVLEANKLVRR
jgi:hypothetical protein